MKVTQVAILPTEASQVAGRPALTPELLAASGARYSRNNEGLDAILSKIDHQNLDKSVDSIFKLIDYGHQSIADMVPVAMFIDDISIWLAYYVWSLCPTAGGQESSTRYIRMSADGLVPPAELGIPETDFAGWHNDMSSCFAAYHQALAYWEHIAANDPTVARIPKSLIDDPSDKAQKQVARMKRNFGFDRARYFLPVAAATNMMLIMSARGWTQLCQYLLSHPLQEAQKLGKRIVDELQLSAPRLIRHAKAMESITRGLESQFAHIRANANAQQTSCTDLASSQIEESPTATLEILPPAATSPSQFADDLAYHENRYAWIGDNIRRTAVRFGWNAVAMAEIRDLNRHRTGSKYCPLIPRGFYYAADQIPTVQGQPSSMELHELAKLGKRMSCRTRSRLQDGEHAYIYWSLLGTQYSFEHTTTADKFIYEAELRTGTGAHFRYAEHLRNVLKLWYEMLPETKGLIVEGSAEPE